MGWEQYPVKKHNGRLTTSNVCQKVLRLGLGVPLEIVSFTLGQGSVNASPPEVKVPGVQASIIKLTSSQGSLISSNVYLSSPRTCS